MSFIKRNPAEASREKYDIIIVGGGIYGIMLSVIASDRGLKSLLIEKNDFGGATSFNHLRIIHGGLRYLQSLDFPRFFESVRERKWFIKTFPDLVHPIDCLMPLYNRGLHRTPLLRAALMMNDFFSLKRNSGVSEESILPSGRIISKSEVEKIFPLAEKKNLKSGAVWSDGSIPDPQRVMIELLKLAVSNDASVLNYVGAVNLMKEENKVSGVEAVDSETGEHYLFRSGIVINSAGPWTRELGRKFDNDYENLFRPSIAWNILFNKKALSDYALAVTPDKPDAKTYFLRPWKSMLLAGTVHEPWSGDLENPLPTDSSVKKFIEDLNNSVPGLKLSREDILHIFSGLLPARETGTSRLAVREVILDHAESGGPAGFFSISGVKFTTARLVAEKTINKILPESKNVSIGIMNSPVRVNKEESGLFSFYWHPDDNSAWKKTLKKIIENESVIHLDDLIVRRTSLGDNPARALEIAPEVCDLFDWNQEKKEAEIKRLHDYYSHTASFSHNSAF